MAVLPRTQLGYTLGIKRDRDIISQGEKDYLKTHLSKVEVVLEWQEIDE